MELHVGYNNWLILVENMFNFLKLPKEYQQNKEYTEIMYSLIDRWIKEYDPENTREGVWQELHYTATNRPSIDALMSVH